MKKSILSIILLSSILTACKKELEDIIPEQ